MVSTSSATNACGRIRGTSRCTEPSRESNVNPIIQKLLANNVASGGMVLLGGGTLIASLRNVPARIWRHIKNRTVLNLTVTSDDEAFQWIEHWVTEQTFAKKTRSMRLVSRKTSGQPSSARDYDEDEELDYALVPGDGQHMLRYKQSYVWLTIDREKLQMSQESKAFVITMTLRMFRGSRELLIELLDEACRMYQERYKKVLRIYAPSNYGDGWITAMTRPPRPVESLVLAPGLFDGLKADLARFYDRVDWYQSMGIPHRRGYLLYGPPGNGKSSLIHTLAASVNKSVAVLS